MASLVSFTSNWVLQTERVKWTLVALLEKLNMFRGVNCLCRGLGSSVGDSSDGQFGSFVDGLGPGQIVGRQVLGSPCMGEVQLSIADRKGQLEVEVIRARALGAKPGAKVLPGRLLSLSSLCCVS